VFVMVPAGLASRAEVSTSEEEDGVVAKARGDRLKQLVAPSPLGLAEARRGSGELSELFIGELLERRGWLVDDFASGVRRVLTGNGSGRRACGAVRRRLGSRWLVLAI
jgi:hypothetical protein